MKNSWNREGVSPVIATILMVAITVVLAAVLYVMVMGISTSGPTAETPLGLNQQARNDTSVTILVSSANPGSRINGTNIAITQDGLPQHTNATLYYSNGNPAATYTNGVWTLTNNEAPFTDGMLIHVFAANVHHGDKITMSGRGYGVSILFVD